MAPRAIKTAPDAWEDESIAPRKAIQESTLTAEFDRPTIVFSDVYRLLYGAQRSMLQLYSHWHQQGKYRLHFAYTKEGPLHAAIRDLGIEATLLPVGPLLGSYHKKLLRLRWWEHPSLTGELLTYSWALRRLLIRLHADLLHCNTDRIGLMSFVGARWAGCPMVTHLRRDTTFGWFDRLIYRGSNEIVWVSNRIRVEFGRVNGIVDPKGRVIYNGRVLPDADGPSTRPKLLAEFALPSDTRLVLMAASFDVCKDHETIVAAAEIACRQDRRVCFLLAGVDLTPNQGRRREIEGRVREAGLSGRVLFLGHRSDIGRLMRGVDLVVNSAKQEALGGALIEAIGYGVPCVATDTGGTAEILPHGRCGYLVPRRDHTSMAARLLELLHDPEMRREFGRNGRARFAERFTLTRCAADTAEFFDNLIEARRARRKGPLTRVDRCAE